MDLTKQPPRRPSNLSILGLVNLARMADKARADSDETLGEYVYGMNSGLDETLLEFLGISEEDFTDAADRYTDDELGQWVQKATGKTEVDIDAFNQELLNRVPKDEAGIARLNARVEKYAPGSTHIKTGFQSIELEDWGDYKDVDLTQWPPRTPYCRDVAGIYAVARMADKGRADKTDNLGEYIYNCPIDQAVLGFLGISHEAFQDAAYANPNDLELGAWVLEHTGRTRGEIAAFNAGLSGKGPETDDQRAIFEKTASGRTDITTWFDLIDLDDENSFGMVDLTRHAPRSPYDASVWGMVAMGRMIDKGRAAATGTEGDFYSCEDSGVDRGILAFLGISADAFRAALKENPTDDDMAAWLSNTCPKTEVEIQAFNYQACTMAPDNDRATAFFQNLLTRIDPSRTDITTWFALMQLDDHVAFARLKAGV